ncbi:hypothetical protein JCM8547_004010 [Rhodosporidiobolus lusitaniae]
MLRHKHDRSFSSEPLLPSPAAFSPFSQAKGAVLTSKAARAAFVAVALLLTVHFSGWLRSEGPPPVQEEEVPRPDFKALDIDQVEHSRSVTFRSFLKLQAGADAMGELPRLWTTTADRRTIKTTAAALEYRVRQLNTARAHDGLGTPPTALVVLCGDRECMEECKAKETFSCYGGFINTRPVNMKISPWLKLAGIVDALDAGRDILFVDSDVAVNGDPYPILEPAMDAVDLVAVENATNSEGGPLSSNFIWSRSTSTTLNLWNEVLTTAMNAPNQPIDEIINSILKTTEMRQKANVEKENRPNWVSESGVRVHVLNKQQFASWHPWSDLDEPEVEPVVSQLTCAGDMLYKDYVAKSKGYLGNAGAYYSNPPKILQLPAMVGTKDELKQLLKISITAAKLTGRSLQPPATATFLDVLSPTTHEPVTLPIYAAFPLPYLSRALDFSLLESSYATRAHGVLTDPSLVAQSTSTRRLASELRYPGELDLRTTETIFDLVRRLTFISYASERVVRMSYLDSPRTNWREWSLSTVKATKVVQPCRKLEVGPTSCGEVCRLPQSWRDGIVQEEWENEDAGVLLSREMGKRIEEPWPPIQEFLMEGGWTRE